MKYCIIICLSFFVFPLTGFSQEKTITHKVKKKETIAEIAKEYNVTPYDIYQLNPDAQNGLEAKTILIIPQKKNTSNSSSQAKTHKVQPKETLYGIEKLYGVSDEDLKKANPDLEKTGLQIGQTLVIPTNSKPSTAQAVYHVVLPKETKYSISKQYNTTIEALEKKNPDIITGLPIGYRLLISGTPSKPSQTSVSVVGTTDDILKSTNDKPSSDLNYVEYEVKPKETMYSLSKQFGLSQEELIKLNPTLSAGVGVGMLIKVPSNSKKVKKEYAVLSKEMTNRKKIVLLLPFNIVKIEGDTVNSTVERLKKDKFLNMTLDFYSGALMAIDSAKTLGLPIDVSIFDSQETKNSSTISSIKLKNANAIIGPFYQNNIEKVATLLVKDSIPVISPLSKEVGNAFPNVYQTVPTYEILRTAMFDYLRLKNGNTIAVIDKKKESSRQYIRENQKEVIIVPLLDNGSVSIEDLKRLLVKDKMNYVILETANTVMIKSTIKTLVDALPDYQIQMVILEANDTLETDEINFENLVKLKLTYPSVTRENESPTALIFEKEYKKKNKILPSVYATRGFDVTFDTMMRLSQEENFQETVEAVATEQVDNKFEYYKREGGEHINKGVYILYYDSDLTIKVAN